MTESPRMKGAMLAGFLGWYVERRDPQRLREVMAASAACGSAGVRYELPAFGVVPSGWYPSEVFHGLLDAVTAGMGEREIEALASEGAEHATERLVRGLYGVLFSLVATPDRYAKYIQRAWRQLHSSGEREVRIVRAGEATSVTRAWPGHHPVMCSIVNETTRAVFSRMNVGDVKVSREKCVSRGHDECVARVLYGAAALTR